MIGFTETETLRILNDFQKSANFKFLHSPDELLTIMKPWYNRNCFSEEATDAERMFNSDMVWYFMCEYIANEGKLPKQMIDDNVSTDYHKMRLMIKHDENLSEKERIVMKVFTEGKTYTQLRRQFALTDLARPQCIVSLLFYMGLLTYDRDENGRTILVVPNAVVQEQYVNYICETYDRQFHWVTDSWTLDDMGVQMQYDGDIMPMLEYIAKSMHDNSSVRDFCPDGENFVKAYMLAQLAQNKTSFLTQTEREHNHGYSDILMRPLQDGKHFFIIEIKYLKPDSTDAEVKKKEEESTAQIKRYIDDHALTQEAAMNGWTLHPVILVFQGWDMKVCSLIEI